MSMRIRKRMILFPLVLILLAATATLAPSASAAGTVIGTISPSSVPAGASQATSFTIAPTSGQVGSFNLTAPTGWALSSLTPVTGVTLVGNQIQGRNLSLSSSLTINFTALAPCSPSSGTWGLVARSNGNFNGGTLGNDPASVLSVTLSGTCTAAFVANRGPTDAAFNGGTSSQNITSEPYTPGGLQMQALVSDANGNPRPGISVTLQLAGGTSGAGLSGPITATSGTGGVATFAGTVTDPIAIDKTGLNYTLTPGATGVVGTASTGFGVYQEGKSCIANQSCLVHGKSADNHLDATVTSADNGTLAVTVQDFALTCEGTAVLVDAPVIIWKKTGTGSQTVTAFIDKFLVRTILNRGSSHIDVCFQTDNGKEFVDKFGNVDGDPTTGYLSDCGPGITTYCIISETGVNGGGRLITFTVEDGKGRI
jgi:hypothetical protein